MDNKFIVYVVYSDTFNKHFTSFTSRLEERIQSHNDEAGRGYTKKYKPWRLIHTKEFDTKAEAMDYEKWLKSGVGIEFIKALPH